MKINNKQLITELLAITERLIVVAKGFKEFDLARLQSRPASRGWSILECLEHLNLYGDFYLPNIEAQLLGRKKLGSDSYSPGIIGNYFVRLIRVQDKQKKLSTTTDKNPALQNTVLGITVIDRFLRQQDRLKALLNRAETLDLGKIKTPVSISKLIKLKLGDTLRFVVYHNERHICQAQRIVSSWQFPVKQF